MKRFSNIVYSIAAYAIFFLSLLTVMAFMANAWLAAPMDAVPRSTPGIAALINLLLVGLMVTHHCLMARPGKPRWWWPLVPRQLRRSTCFLLSGTSVLLLILLWQPDGRLVWQWNSPWVVSLVQAMYVIGCLVVLFNAGLLARLRAEQLRGFWRQFTGRILPGPFRGAHTLLLPGAWLLIFWCIPSMTASHFQFSVVATAVVLYDLIDGLLGPEHGAAITNETGRWFFNEAGVPDDIQ